VRFHHVGIACRDINRTKEWVKKNYPVIDEGQTVFDPLQEARVSLLRLVDGFSLELISGKPVEDFLKRGMSLYHVCYTVADIQQTIRDLEKNGATLISPAKEAVLFNRKRVAFLHTPIGIVELLEE